MSNKKYVLNYFNKHGKVELCRLVMAAAKIDYEDNFIENLTDSGLLNTNIAIWVYFYSFYSDIEISKILKLPSCLIFKSTTQRFH